MSVLPELPLVKENATIGSLNVGNLIFVNGGIQTDILQDNGSGKLWLTEEIKLANINPDNYVELTPSDFSIAYENYKSSSVGLLQDGHLFVVPDVYATTPLYVDVRISILLTTDFNDNFGSSIQISLLQNGQLRSVSKQIPGLQFDGMGTPGEQTKTLLLFDRLECVAGDSLDISLFIPETAGFTAILTVPGIDSHVEFKMVETQTIVIQ